MAHRIPSEYALESDLTIEQKRVVAERAKIRANLRQQYLRQVMDPNAPLGESRENTFASIFCSEFEYGILCCTVLRDFRSPLNSRLQLVCQTAPYWVWEQVSERESFAFRETACTRPQFTRKELPFNRAVPWSQTLLWNPSNDCPIFRTNRRSCREAFPGCEGDVLSVLQTDTESTAVLVEHCRSPHNSLRLLCR